jgi:hypothetical protein
VADHTKQSARQAVKRQLIKIALIELGLAMVASYALRYSSFYPLTMIDWLALSVTGYNTAWGYLWGDVMTVGLVVIWVVLAIMVPVAIWHRMPTSPQAVKEYEATRIKKQKLWTICMDMIRVLSSKGSNTQAIGDLADHADDYFDEATEENDMPLHPDQDPTLLAQSPASQQEKG